MSDDKATDDLRARAAFAVAKHAVERALDDAMLSDEDRAKKRAEETALSRSKRNKRIAIGVIGLLLLIGVIGLVLNYWYWALLLGLLGAGGWYARRRWRARKSAKKSPKKLEPATTQREAPVARKVRVEPRPAPVAEPSDESIDDDLAELKARMKR